MRVPFTFKLRRALGTLFERLLSTGATLTEHNRVFVTHSVVDIVDEPTKQDPDKRVPSVFVGIMKDSNGVSSFVDRKEFIHDYIVSRVDHARTMKLYAFKYPVVITAKDDVTFLAQSAQERSLFPDDPEHQIWYKGEDLLKYVVDHATAPVRVVGTQKASVFGADLKLTHQTVLEFKFSDPKDAVAAKFHLC